MNRQRFLQNRCDKLARSGAATDYWLDAAGPTPMSQRRASPKLMMAAWTALLVVAWATSPAAAGESYFMAVFSSEHRPVNWAHYAHSFASFVKVTGEGARLDGYSFEVVTISWVPRTLNISPYRVLPECGMNLDLASTLQWANQHELCVSMWGPYQIDPCLY